MAEAEEMSEAEEEMPTATNTTEVPWIKEMQQRKRKKKRRALVLADLMLLGGAGTNVLAVQINSVPIPYPGNGAFLDTLRTQNEADTRGL
jgi:hypothetical protein